MIAGLRRGLLLRLPFLLGGETVSLLLGALLSLGRPPGIPAPLCFLFCLLSRDLAFLSGPCPVGLIFLPLAILLCSLMRGIHLGEQ